jgi:putative acetyltransferase
VRSFQLVEVSDPAEMPAVRKLFQEYADWLGVDLCFQGFAEELANLPGIYSRPRGFIYLVRDKDENAGCIALKPLNENECEMKRLYVRDAYRGQGLGRKLVQLCLDEAKKIGYRRMKLDTLQRMQPAIRLYESFGFSQTGAYYENPEADVVYMEREL